jgi:hypothetical protein
MITGPFTTGMRSLQVLVAFDRAVPASRPQRPTVAFLLVMSAALGPSESPSVRVFQRSVLFYTLQMPLKS